MLTESDLTEIAQKLAGEAVVSLQAARKGGNNRLFKVVTAKRSYALKFHLYLPDDSRDRQGAETKALAFLNAHGVKQVPHLYAHDQQLRCSLMEWISGSQPTSPTATDIDAVLALIAKLQKLGRQPQALQLPMASAACLSGVAIELQIKQRLARLAPHLADHQELACFIRVHFAPLLEATIAQVKNNYQQNSYDFYSETPRQYQVLSPSDFGFHNALRCLNNELVFLDFEYFGWDDPVKLTADFLLHPGMNIASLDIGTAQNNRERFKRGIGKIFAADPTFSFRLQQLYPLFGFCWCMIILNEFIPEVWQRRVLAANSTVDRQTVLNRQLTKAKQLLLAVVQEDSIDD